MSQTRQMSDDEAFADALGSGGDEKKMVAAPGTAKAQVAAWKAAEASRKREEQKDTEVSYSVM